jgi:hypothetical protein
MTGMLGINQWLPPGQEVARILLDAGVKSVAVLAVAGVAMVCMMRRSAAARHLVCFLAMASLLALPVLSWSLPGWRVLPGWMDFRQAKPAGVERQAKTLSPAEPSAAVRPAPRRIGIAVPATSEMALPAQVPSAAVPTAAAARPLTDRARLNWWQTGLLVWLVGVLFALAPAVFGLLSLRRLELASRRETAACWLDLLGQLLTSLSFKRRGVVLLHELAHAQRCDYLTHLVTRLICALYWFNPLVWPAARRMIAERERACDDIVLRHGAKPADYAQHVLEISAGLPSGWLAGRSGVAMVRGSNLEGRLRAILDGRRNRAAATRTAVVSALIALSAIFVPVAMMTAAPAGEGAGAAASSPDDTSEEAMGSAIGLSALVAAGETVSEPVEVPAGQPDVVACRFDFKVAEVLKGIRPDEDTIPARIYRRRNEGAPPEFKKGDRRVLFLDPRGKWLAGEKQPWMGRFPASDVQPASPAMIATLKRLAAIKPVPDEVKLAALIRQYLPGYSLRQTTNGGAAGVGSSAVLLTPSGGEINLASARAAWSSLVPALPPADSPRPLFSGRTYERNPKLTALLSALHLRIATANEAEDIARLIFGLFKGWPPYQSENWTLKAEPLENGWVVTPTYVGPPTQLCYQGPLVMIVEDGTLVDASERGMMPAGGLLVPIKEVNAAEPGWGEPVEGLSVRLQSDRPVWYLASAHPVLRLSVRNLGSEVLSVPESEELGELEVDGLWYAWSDKYSGPRKLLPPRRQIEDIAVFPIGSWGKDPRRFPVGAGKHKIRFAVVAQRGGPNRSQIIRAVSNPIEVEFRRGAAPRQRPASPATNGPAAKDQSAVVERHPSRELTQRAPGPASEPRSETSGLHQQSGMAQARESPPAATNQTNTAAGPVNSPKSAVNPSGISLTIRCANDVLRVGDEIPIEFIITNYGTGDYKYVDNTYDRSGRMPQYALIAKTASGESVPDPRPKPFFAWEGGLGSFAVLHPGASFSKTIPLNRWVLIKEPGRYEVAGTYVGETYTDHYSARPRADPISSDSISIIVLPRTQEEMHDYIKGLTNQAAAWLALRANQNEKRHDPVLEALWLKLMYTCSPEIVPSLLGSWYEAGAGPSNEGMWTQEALLYYVPRTEEIWQAIIAAATVHGCRPNMEGLLERYGFNRSELKPIIARALAADHSDEWASGAHLAFTSCYDDAFTARLITIANDSSLPATTRGLAMEALARNRTDAGVKTIEKLINDSEPEVWSWVALAICNGCDRDKESPTGRHLQPEDFDPKEIRTFIERMLASGKMEDQMRGVGLAEWFGDDALTPKLVALATNPGVNRSTAIYALALNRTDEGLKTLKALLNGPDPKVSKIAAEAIRYAYTSRRGYHGRPLRVDDFDARLQQPEVKPPK